MELGAEPSADAPDVLVFDGAFVPGCPAVLDEAWDAIRAALRDDQLIVLIAPPPGDAHAEAARAGLENMARTLSIEWARLGIRPVAIHPGARRRRRRVAELVAFLASPAGAYYSGCRFDLGAAGASGGAAAARAPSAPRPRRPPAPRRRPRSRRSSCRPCTPAATRTSRWTRTPWRAPRRRGRRRARGSRWSRPRPARPPPAAPAPSTALAAGAKTSAMPVPAITNGRTRSPYGTVGVEIDASQPIATACSARPVAISGRDPMRSTARPRSAR